MKNICQNKRAFHDYQVLEKLQAGIALTGTEVKSCRGGGMSLAQSYVAIDQRGSAQLIGLVELLDDLESVLAELLHRSGIHAVSDQYANCHNMFPLSFISGAPQGHRQ